MISTDPSMWIQAVLTLMIWSWFFKMNPTVRWAYTILAACTAGNLMVSAIESINKTGLQKIAQGDFMIIGAIILGALVFTALSRKHLWLSRYGTAMMAAIGFAITIRSTIAAEIIGPTIITMTLPLTTPNMVTNISNLLLIILMVTAMVYFLYFREHKGVYGYVSRIGLWGLLFGLGVHITTLIFLGSGSVLAGLQWFFWDFLGLG